METIKRFIPRFLFAMLALSWLSCKNSGKSQTDEQIKAWRMAGYEAQLKADSLAAQRKTDSAFKYYVKSKGLYEKGGDSIRTTYTLLRMGELYFQLNDYAEMQNTAVEAKKFNGDRKDYLKTIYIQLGISYSSMGNLGRAIENFNKSKRYSKEKWELLTADNNIANAYLFREDYKRAFNVLEPIAQNDLNDSLAIKATILDNFGYTSVKLKHQGGVDFIKKALLLRKKNADTLHLITSYLHLSESFHDLGHGHYLAYADTAHTLAQQHKSPVDRLEVLQFIVEHAPAEVVANYARQYAKLSDSLEDARQRNRNMFAEIKYDNKEAKEDAFKSDLEKEREKSKKLTWIFIAAILALISVGIVFAYLRRREEIKKKAEYDTEVRISNRLHDDLANDVHRTIVFAETNDLSGKEHKETLLSRLETIYSGTRSISHDHSEIPDDADFGAYVKNLLAEYSSDERKVIAQGIPSVHWEKMERLKKVECSRILKELLTNMRKHSDCTHAFFNFAQSGKKVSITYSDNGKGTNDNMQKHKNGLRIMENRISGMGGTATFDSEPGKGFRATIEIRI